MKRIGIVRFLGTNCDRDAWQAVEQVGGAPEWLWAADHFDDEKYAAFILPGGFSFGDYLRCGALAAKSPAMADLHRAVKNGKPVLGICNGFQVLCELNMLPGVLTRNEGLRFIDRWVDLEPIEHNTSWLQSKKTILRIPIAHGEGRYFVDDESLKQLHDNGQIWLKYADNPNGSVDNIAGVCSKDGRVCGLMPHPERAMTEWMGGTDGLDFFARVL